MIVSVYLGENISTVYHAWLESRLQCWYGSRQPGIRRVAYRCIALWTHDEPGSRR